MKYEVQTGIKDCRTKLLQLGTARSDKKHKDTYLHRTSGTLTTMVQAAIDGLYADPLFASYPGQEDAFDRRLRANVQKTLTIYADKMCLHGHALEIVEDDKKPTRTSTSKYVMKHSYLKEVKDLMLECRGCELPGTFNSFVVRDLFGRQCKPWEKSLRTLPSQCMKLQQQYSTRCCPLDEGSRSARTAQASRISQEQVGRVAQAALIGSSDHIERLPHRNRPNHAKGSS